MANNNSTGYRKVSEKQMSELKQTTEKISDLSRYVSFGLLAIYYSIITSNSIEAQKLFNSDGHTLMFLALFAAASLFFDYLQFWFGYLNVRRSISMQDRDDEYIHSWTLSARYISFYLKQLFSWLGVILLFFIILF